MSYELIRYETDAGIATITLNRPDKLNALNWQTMQELQTAFAAARDDAGVRAVILTGAGEKAFAAGADIAELAEKTPMGARDFSMASQEILREIENMPKPVIAAVNGFCLGGGNELAMACHMRWAAENAKFGQPEVNLGIICGNGGTQRLPRLVGKGKAIELVISGVLIDAAEARAIGLVNHVVPADALLAACREFLATVMKKGPVAVRLSLEGVRDGLEMPLERAVQHEAELFGLAFSTNDMKEGTTAFLEKRKPAFTGS